MASRNKTSTPSCSAYPEPLVSCHKSSLIVPLAHQSSDPNPSPPRHGPSWLAQLCKRLEGLYGEENIESICAHLEESVSCNLIVRSGLRFQSREACIMVGICHLNSSLHLSVHHASNQSRGPLRSHWSEAVSTNGQPCGVLWLNAKVLA